MKRTRPSPTTASPTVVRSTSTPEEFGPSWTAVAAVWAPAFRSNASRSTFHDGEAA
jgi:hypothetical protein